MLYITGDTHIPHDINKLNVKNFPEQKLLTKNDYILICGDFGGVWDNSEQELWWRNWLDEKPFTTLWIDGNHENFDLLNTYEVKEWNGGKVHYISDSIIHLMRGQVYDIDGFKLFTMGGANSIDKMFRLEGYSWWKEEIPSKEEFDEALSNLEKHNWNIDYVITHTTSTSKMEELCYIKERNELNSFFDMLEKNLEYKHWYFGHFHENVEFENGKHTLLFDRIKRII